MFCQMVRVAGSLSPPSLTNVSVLISIESNYIANMANVASCIYNALNEFHGGKGVNWAGFYIVRIICSCISSK